MADLEAGIDEVEGEEDSLFRTWKQIIMKQMGRKWKKLMPSIITNLEAVNQGLKPAFLWDIAAIECDQLLTLVSQLKNLGILRKQIHVLSVSQELLVVDLYHVECLVRSVAEKNIKRYFVDVSECLKMPVFVDEIAEDNICEIMEMLVKEIEQFFKDMQQTGLWDNLLVIKAHKNWNIPMILGVMLGYPVVYFYAMDGNENGSSCLPFVPLTIYRVKGKMCYSSLQNETQHEIYSFSVPCCLLSETSVHVQDWFKKEVNSVPQQFFETLWMEDEVVVLPSVIL